MEPGTVLRRHCFASISATPAHQRCMHRRVCRTGRREAPYRAAEDQTLAGPSMHAAAPRPSLSTPPSQPLCPPPQATVAAHKSRVDRMAQCPTSCVTSSNLGTIRLWQAADLAAEAQRQGLLTHTTSYSTLMAGIKGGRGRAGGESRREGARGNGTGLVEVCNLRWMKDTTVGGVGWGGVRHCAAALALFICTPACAR